MQRNRGVGIVGQDFRKLNRASLLPGKLNTIDFRQWYDSRELACCLIIYLPDIIVLGRVAIAGSGATQEKCTMPTTA